MRQLCNITALLLALTTGVHGFAQPTQELTEEERLEQAVYFSDLGRLHFENERFAEAAEAFAQAWEYQPDPVLGYNAARSFENSGVWQRALEFYEATLELEDTDEDIGRRCRDGVTRIENILSRIQQELENEPAVLTVETDPAGVNVWIGEDLFGVTPVEAPLEAGIYSVRLERGGYEPVVTEVTLEAGQTLAMRVSLEALTEPQTPSDPEEAPVETHPNWIAVGTTGGVAVILTAVAATLATDAHNEYEHGELPDTLRDKDELERTISDGQRSQTASNVLYGVGLAAAATAVVLIFVTEVEETAEDEDPETTDVSFNVGASASGGSVGVLITF